MGYRGCRTIGALLLTFLSAFLAGCGSGSAGPTAPPGSPLIIITQPASQTVPLNQPATFTVQATGGVAPYRYQWTKNGTPISGYPGDAYTTPAVALSDNNETFVVTVTDSSGNGSVVSNPATLTIGPRSPNPLDLRFQQVAAPSTANGYGGSIASILLYGGIGFPNSTGEPLALGPGACGTYSAFNPLGCAWNVGSFYLPANVTGLSINYWSSSLDSLDTYLATTLDNPSIVVTSLDTESKAYAYGVAYMTTTQTNGFQMERNVLDLSGLQEAASQEGAQSRVITAVSYNAGQIEYLSYGWTVDTSIPYEAKIATATFDTVTTEAANLAADGYIITAFGGNTDNGFVLVGTRVKGDSLPRPFRTALLGEQETQLWTPGYAIVGELTDYTSHTLNLTYIGEK